MKALVIENEKNSIYKIDNYLKRNGYKVDSAFDAEEALGFIDVGEYDVIITNVMIPNMNGYDLVRKIRRSNIDTPIIIMTEKASLSDKIRGLDLGADDFMTGPFEYEELMARIRVLVRRKQGHFENKISVDNLCINLTEKSVIRNGIEINLTGKEYEILEYLMCNRNRVVTRNMILDHIWGFDYDENSNSLDVLIKNLRKKIDIGDSKKLIYTKRGFGYLISDRSL